MGKNISDVPAPWPQKPRPDGSLYGELPLTLPRKQDKCATVVIKSRDNGVTTFDIKKNDTDKFIEGKVDTINERYLGLISLTNSKGAYRLCCSSMDFGRAIALLGLPPVTSERIHVDHANGNPMDNTQKNVHFVTASFNTFNIAKKRDGNGFFGLYTANGCDGAVFYRVVALTLVHGQYQSAETAALVYNVVCRNIFADQLDKTPHLLNVVANEDERSVTVAVLPSGVSIHRVDDIFVCFFEEKIRGGKHKTLAEAEQAAHRLVVDWFEKQDRKEAEWRRKAKGMKVTDREDGVAALDAAGSTRKVLVDDDTWIKVRAMGLSLQMLRSRVGIRVDGKNRSFPRWLTNAQAGTVVDHKNHDPFDNRSTNLRVTNLSANAQNAKRSAGYHGVRLATGYDFWVMSICIVETRRAKTKAFHELSEALEWYDLCALYLHKSGCLLNEPTKQQDYLDKLETDPIKTRVKDFLESPPKKKTAPLYNGVRLIKKAYVGRSASHDKSFNGIGAKTMAAIFSNLWRLKDKGKHRTVNFEFMRPWYLYKVDSLTQTNELDMVAEAYEVIGGDDFKGIHEFIPEETQTKDNEQVVGKRKADDM